MMYTFKKKVGVALATAATSMAVVAGTAVPAMASVPSSFVTPRYEMTCNTGMSGSFGAWKGFATCDTPFVAKWKVTVDCAWGFSHDSYWIWTTEANGWVKHGPDVTCYWGINDVRVVEGI